MNRKRNVLIGVTGSVATIKIYNLLQDLYTISNVEIRIVSTKNALYFYNPTEISEIIYQDQDEWKDYKRGAHVIHIELRNWADIFIIAPLDANTLGKIANGLCDNLLTCIARAWDSNKKVFIAPAMNTEMWKHPLTKIQLETIHKWGFVEIINPISKTLACGDVGIGAMQETNEITKIVSEYLNNFQVTI
jgi:phosphopantothenoylcysteine decarboxylase